MPWSVSQTPPSSLHQANFTPRVASVHPSPADWRDQILYFLLPDRFCDDLEGTRPKFPFKNPDSVDRMDKATWMKAGKLFQHGTLKGIRCKLPYLKELGVTALWIGPVFKQRKDLETYHGYGIQNFLEIDPRFGSRQDLCDLVDDAHQQGMYVLLDIIYNHTGNNWFYKDDGQARDQMKYRPWPPYEIHGWRSEMGQSVPVIGNPEDGVWPSEFQNPDWFTRAGKIGQWDSQEGQSPLDPGIEFRRGDYRALLREKYKMKYDLVFEGGGAKGMVFVGACEELFKRGHTFDRLLGTSAGAITATLLAVGYTPAEMLEALAEKKDGRSVFSGFMASPPPFTDEEIRNSVMRRLLEKIDFKFLFDSWERKLDDQLAIAFAKNKHFRHVVALIERGGWFAADSFVSWFRTKLDSGSWNNKPRSYSGMTLAQLFSETGVELSVVASDTTDQKVLVLNHHTAPDCPSVWAVRMSMSIPLVWDEVIWKSIWGNYLGRDVSGHGVVDGGLISNFPIELFISNEPQVVKLMGSKKGSSVLGMLIDESLPVTAVTSKGLFIDVNVKPTELSTVQRLQRLVDTATMAHDKMVIDEYNHLVARLPAAGYGTTEFDMSDERRNALVEAGRRAMVSYLEKSVELLPPSKGIPRIPGARMPTAADRIASKILE